MHCKCYTVNADNDLTKGLGYKISLIDDVCISTIRVLNGPKELNKYADNFSNLLMQEVSLYKGVLNIVKNFAKNFKNFNDTDTCLEDETYSLIFDKNGLATSLYGPVEIEDDFACITFHQNGNEDPFNEYTDESYAKLITIFFKELEKIGFEKDRIKLNVGYYEGNAEISYKTTCVDNNDLLELEEIARKYNQKSIYLKNEQNPYGTVLYNNVYNSHSNPMSDSQGGHSYRVSAHSVSTI